MDLLFRFLIFVPDDIYAIRTLNTIKYYVWKVIKFPIPEFIYICGR